jgi:hypothetical protein
MEEILWAVDITPEQLMLKKKNSFFPTYVEKKSESGIV